jgi:hypothetical protein
MEPKLKLELLPFHHPLPPLLLELNLNKGSFNIESEYIEGNLRFKDVNLKTMEKIINITLNLVQ